MLISNSYKVIRKINVGRIFKRTLVVDIDKHWDDKGTQVHLLDEKPAETIELNKETGLKLYKSMHLVRQIEQLSSDLYKEKKIRGFCHLYVGQEAVAAGIFQTLLPQDTIITSYRCHGWMLLKCKDPVGLLGELIGYTTGSCRGKGGSMHIYCKGFFGGNGIVGGHVPLGVGIALKHKYTNSDAISVTTYGDGACNQGQVFEAYNLAKLHNLPVLFVIENNVYGLGTASHRAAASVQFYKCCPYIPGIRVNGMDILSVIQASKFALKHIRDGKGPIILEALTYRYRGHSMSDPGTAYRPRDEVKRVQEKRDCLANFAKLLIKSNLATEEELGAIKKENKKECTAALDKAETGKIPGFEELTADCYTHYTGRVKVPQILATVPYKRVAQYAQQ